MWEFGRLARAFGVARELRKREAALRRGELATVWVVLQDDEPEAETILGMFSSSEAADECVEEQADKFEHGVLTGSFDVPYRHEDRLKRYWSKPRAWFPWLRG